MARWNPGDGDPDVLSTGDEQPTRSVRLRTLAVAVVCLGLGAVLATGLDDEAAAPGLAAPSCLSLRAGNVENRIPCRRWCLLLPLFNGGRQPVEVTALGFDGWRLRAPVRTKVIEPRTWGRVRFGLRGCSASQPGHYRYVHVQTSVAGEPQVKTLRMPSTTPLLQEEHTRACPVGVPVTTKHLRGVWLLETSRGSLREQTGTLLMRYGADGSFRWETDGPLAGDGLGADGRYGLVGPTLTVLLDNQNACHTGDVLRWRVTMIAPNRMRMESVRNPSTACSSPSGEVWVVRRILADSKGAGRAATKR